jgi:hypothetical protein
VLFHYIIQHIYGTATQQAVAVAADDALAVQWMTLQRITELHTQEKVSGSVPAVLEYCERAVQAGLLPVADSSAASNGQAELASASDLKPQ